MKAMQKDGEDSGGREHSGSGPFGAPADWSWREQLSVAGRALAAHPLYWLLVAGILATVEAPRSLFGPLVAPLGLPDLLAYGLEACLPLVVASGVAAVVLRGAEGPFPEGPSWLGHIPGAVLGLPLACLLSALVYVPVLALFGARSDAGAGLGTLLQLLVLTRLIVFFQQSQVLEGLGVRAAFGRSWSLSGHLHEHVAFVLLLETVLAGALVTLATLHGGAGELLPAAILGPLGWALRTLGHLVNAWVAASLTTRYLATRAR